MSPPAPSPEPATRPGPLFGASGATRHRRFLDGLILATSLFLLAWSTVLAPLWRAAGSRALPSAVPVAYPLGALLLVTTALAVRTRRAGTPEHRDRVSGPLAMVVPYALVFAACCVEVWRCGTTGAGTVVERPVLVGLLALVLVRQALVLVENRSLLLRVQRKEDLSRRQAQHLEDVLRAVRELTEAADETSATLILGDVVRELLGADRVIVFLRDGDSSGRYLARTVAGAALARDHVAASPEGSARVVPDSKRGLLYREPGRGGDLALATGEVVLASDTSAAGSIGPELVSELGVTSVGWVPVPAEDGHIGVFALSWRARRCTLSAFERSVLAVLAQHAGSVLTQLRQVARLEAETRTDPLTGLANRGAVDAAVAALQPGDTVALLDLDHFKQLNDTRGHDAGDAALVSFAAALRTAGRRQDLAGRFGGEEFVLLLTQTDEATARDVVARLRSTWAASGAPVTFSAGVAAVGPDTPEHALHAADRALYAAKRAGRDRISVASEVSQILATRG